MSAILAAELRGSLRGALSQLPSASASLQYVHSLQPLAPACVPSQLRQLQQEPHQTSMLMAARLASNSLAGPSSSCSLPHLPWSMQQRSIFSGFAAPQAKKYSQRRLVGWSPEQFYQVVSDVQEYHKFVPWCQKSHVMTRRADGSYMEAELEIGFQMLVERYVSKVTLKPPNRVESRVEDSMLFHHLESSWTMNPGPSPGTCWLAFHVDFAFNSALYGHLADIFFSEVVQRMVAAFEGRCQQLYGPSSLITPRRATQHRHSHSQRTHAAAAAHQGAELTAGRGAAAQRPEQLDEAGHEEVQGAVASVHPHRSR